MESDGGSGVGVGKTREDVFRTFVGLAIKEEIIITIKEMTTGNQGDLDTKLDN